MSPYISYCHPDNKLRSEFRKFKKNITHTQKLNLNECNTIGELKFY